MRKYIQIFSFLLISGLLACGSCSSSKLSENGIGRLTNGQFRKEAKKPNTVIIDVRTPEEFQTGHIEGAKLINVQDSGNFIRQIHALDPAKHYLLYCRTGKRSMNAATIMQTKGFTKVSDLRDGISEWDGPTVTDKK
jgi:rhodanese-related sulfurtransferase